MIGQKKLKSKPGDDHNQKGKSVKQPSFPPTVYRPRPVVPAQNYDVISFARTMNDDFGSKVQELFEPEKQAALEALESGVYVGWRLPNYKHDCQRVASSSMCFCGHLLMQHQNKGRGIVPSCCEKSCTCKSYRWIPTRPEEVGEFWRRRRRDFCPDSWEAKCRCKHTHLEHDPTGLGKCRNKGCFCGVFKSSFLCAACDKHWEEHETFFDSIKERKEKGLPTGEEYLPFAEIPSLQRMVLTGEDDGDLSYMRLQEGPYAVPPRKGDTLALDNTASFKPGNSRSSKDFRPVYD